jgi:hypothetical protein
MGREKDPRANRDYARLMNKVCVGLGYCGCIKGDKPIHVDDFIPSYGMVTAAQFAEWVILAEGLNPTLAPSEHIRAIRTAFIEFMGADVVDASRLKWHINSDGDET